MPADVARCEKGWRAIRFCGSLDFALTGVLARAARVLADAGISIFALSTFETDYILVRSARLDDARRALAEAGYRFEA